MAEHGVKVLVIEREQRFRDRGRGEFLAPWGYSEAHGLGISDCLRSVETEIPWMDVYAVTERMVHRELVSTTPQQLPSLAFYHPSMQESLLGAAAGAGAAVRRGAAVCEVEVQPGAAPKFVVQENGRTETFAARLVVGAEGRSSVVRSSAKFQVARDPEDMMIAGVLFENMRAAEDTFELIYHFGLGQFVGVFPQGRGQVRVYLSYHAGTQPQFQGEADLARFIQGCRNTGANPAYFKDARPIGPLATFDAAHIGWITPIAMAWRCWAIRRHRVTLRGARASR